MRVRLTRAATVYCLGYCFAAKELKDFVRVYASSSRVFAPCALPCKPMSRSNHQGDYSSGASIAALLPATYNRALANLEGE